MKEFGYIVLTMMLLFSCQSDNIQSVNTPKQVKDTLISIDRFYRDDSTMYGTTRVYFIEANRDSLYKELVKYEKDELFYFSENDEPFLFLGHLPKTEEEKNKAIIISSPNDSLYKIELFVFKSKKWIKTSDLDIPSCRVKASLRGWFSTLNGFYLECLDENYKIISEHKIIRSENGKLKIN